MAKLLWFVCLKWLQEAFIFLSQRLELNEHPWCSYAEGKEVAEQVVPLDCDIFPTNEHINNLGGTANIRLVRAVGPVVFAFFQSDLVITVNQ